MNVALAMAGVQNAELLDDDVSLLVQYDPAQVDSLEIASAINREAFFVTVEEEIVAAESLAVAESRRN